MGNPFSRVITFDPLSQYKPQTAELVIHDPDDLKAVMREAGKSQPFRVLYQPRSGAILEH
jgi:ribulose bisphosphate carboxylase small subunit